MAIISTNEYSSTNVSDWFIEIQQPKENTSLPERVDCYILVNIDPKCCGDLARELNAILPLRSSSASDDKSNTDESFGDAPHQVPVTDQLKRIRRRPATIGELELVTQQNNRNLPVEARSDEAPTKRAKKNNQHNQSKSGPSSRTWSLDILVGSVEATERLLQRKKNTTKHDINSDNKPLTLESILAKYNMTTNLLVRRSLPGRPAETKEELQLWNTTLWPTLFFEKKTTQFKEEELQLSNEEKVIMITGMEAAVQDAHLGIQQWKTYFPNSDFMKSCDISGVVVMDPQNGSVVSRASDERQLQADQWQSFPDKINPLCTSTILAIQGVSRIERESAIGHGIESKEFQRGQVSLKRSKLYFVHVMMNKENNYYTLT